MADRERPVFDPARSLGWRTGPLDGLSCLLRCTEAVLRAQGFAPLDVARALALPVDLTGGRRGKPGSAAVSCPGATPWTGGSTGAS